MQQFDTISDLLVDMENIDTATNMAVAVNNDAVFIALFSSDESVMYVQISPTEFKNMAKTVIEHINIGLN